MRNSVVTILDAADTASQTGSSVNVNQVVSASFQPIFGDVTAAGTVKLQASNDLPPQGQQFPFVPTNWADIPNATSAITAGVGSMIVIGNMCFQSIRAVYTRTSGGSSTVVVKMNALSI